MPKIHPPQRRNRFNETQECDGFTGQFMRRHDDGAVTVCVSRSGMFKEAMAKAREKTQAEKRRKAGR